MVDSISDINTDNAGLLSRIGHLVKTNEDLEDPLKAKLILARDALEPQRRRLNEELERLQRAILLANRKMDVLDAALAPVRRLSPDILLEIFDFSLPTKPSPQRRRALLSLCHVTSSWRAISLGAPILWSSAFISLEYSQIPPKFGETEPSPYQSFKESMLEEWFQRAGMIAPLSLFLEFHSGYAALGATRGHWYGEKSLYALVKPYATRLKHLHITSCFIGRRFFTLDTLSVLNTMQTLVVQGIALDFPQRIPFLLHGPDLKLPAHPSSLHRLKITSETFGGDLHRLLLPWNQLTHLSINSVTNHVWYPLLRGCPKLIHGNFGFSEVMVLGSFPADGASPIIALVELKSLSLSFHQSPINPHVTNNLSLPQLCQLRLASNRPDNPELWHHTDKFWPKIQKLEELGLYGGTTMNLMYPVMLAYALNVTRLELQIAASPGEIFRLLSSPLPSPLFSPPFAYNPPEVCDVQYTLLPKLQHLFIMVTLPKKGRHWVNERIPTFPVPFNINTLRKFFSVRASLTVNKSVPQLCEVFLRDNYAARVPSAGLPVSESLLEVIEDLESEGLPVKVAERDPYLVEEEQGDWGYLPFRTF